MKVPVAYWMNGLGEDCSSQVYATFLDDGGQAIVVKNWRSNEYQVLLEDDVRIEFVEV